jgi:hypothetical protein
MIAPGFLSLFGQTWQWPGEEPRLAMVVMRDAQFAAFQAGPF